MEHIRWRHMSLKKSHLIGHEAVSSRAYTDYRKISNISGTKSQNLNGSRLVLQLYLPNPLNPNVRSSMMM